VFSHQVSKSAAESESRNPGVRYLTASGCQSMRLRPRREH